MGDSIIAERERTKTARNRGRRFRSGWSVMACSDDAPGPSVEDSDSENRQTRISC